MTRFICCILLLVSLSASSQRVFFVYLQTEPEQPFFVKIGDKVHSSSGSGYLILSKLKDSIYNFKLGFPQNKFPEQEFKVDIKAADHGYLVKNFGEKGWGLYDMQTMAIQMASAENDKTVKTEPKQVSAFTEVLSKAANDPTLKEKTIAVKQEEKVVVVPPPVIKEEVVPAKTTTPPPVAAKEEVVAVKEADKTNTVTEEAKIKKEEPLVVIKEVVKEEKKEAIIPVVQEYTRSKVTKRSESSTTEGFGLTYIDEALDGKKDTIRIIIPNSKVQAAETKDEKKFLDIPVEIKETTQSPVNEQVADKVIAKNNCPAVATENDFLKLRKKMAGETNDDAMVAEAKKAFKSKCFTTEQLKNLSSLFLKDDGKYKFFDASYTAVIDMPNFAGLSSELKDEYYVSRFKAMLRN